jgi:hypothetical protein
LSVPVVVLVVLLLLVLVLVLDSIAVMRHLAPCQTHGRIRR